MGHAERANKVRKKMLRDLVFSPYDPSTRDEFGFAPLASRAFILLYQAIANAPSGNIEQTHRGVSVFNKIKKSSESSGSDGNRRLRVGGATIRLTNEELEYSRKMLERTRDNIPVAQADALLHLDELFTKAPELKEEDLLLEAGGDLAVERDP